ncbi:MAG: hypothetical protein KDA44_12965 [Planctomycetales bacterium]|nr:hypothetical protein [Planctomycetales bacterium]
MTVTDRSPTRDKLLALDARLAAYAAASGAAVVAASTAEHADAAIVANTIEQPFGINGEVNIDFNGDGQIDFQVDHDRVDIPGSTLDYLQIDKNDVNGASNPLDFDPLPGFTSTTFPPNATTANNADNAKYVIPSATATDYPAALSFGTPIGPASNLNWQETASYNSTGNAIRANRLIDEDAGQIDQVLGGLTTIAPTNGPNFIGLGGEVRYLGLQMDLNGTGALNYGWVGIRIDNEADATGAVVGYGYETTPGTPIGAGVVPEPSTLIAAAFGVGVLACGRLFGRRKATRR